MIENNNNGIYCKFCGTDSIIENDRSEIVCQKCGTCFGHELDYGCDWRAFNFEENTSKNHIGAPPTSILHDKGMSTYIGNQQMDGTSAAINTLRVWQARSTTMDSNERNLSKALGYLSVLSSSFNLTKNTRETAANLYRKMLQKNLIRGRTITGMMTACVFLSCKINKTPLSIRVILQNSTITKKKLLHCIRTISSFIKTMPPLSPVALISNYTSKLRLPGEVEITSFKILNKVLPFLRLRGAIPNGIACATIYIAAHLQGMKISQNEVAKVASITENTERTNYRKICRLLKLKITVI